MAQVPHAELGCHGEVCSMPELLITGLRVFRNKAWRSQSGPVVTIPRPRPGAFTDKSQRWIHFWPGLAAL